MCGEYVKGMVSIRLDWGSPPHVWRIRDGVAGGVCGVGITSTCVENTNYMLGGALSIEDHLHMCGEYIFLAMALIDLAGSPPHVWRIPILGHVRLTNIWITSTCVENTLIYTSL